ncbi:hypothetical protein NHX12_003973 [Muraenolepis orangiensis]|uniref:Uncharacterized protein n=1 Tax=Muraenolepis orangiensis TaxID=630683 RepID=A0A9Q0DUD3_9TELE|nr:hypothetical protein NHX12_003973 [Muraenolepis orangiensis]
MRRVRAEQEDADSEDQDEEHGSSSSYSPYETDSDDSDSDDSELTEDSEDGDDWESVSSKDSGYESNFSLEETPENSRPSSPQENPESLDAWARNPSFEPLADQDLHEDRSAFLQERHPWSKMRSGELSPAPCLGAPYGSGKRSLEEAYGEAGDSSDGAPLQKRQRSEYSDDSSFLWYCGEGLVKRDIVCCERYYYDDYSVVELQGSAHVGIG